MDTMPTHAEPVPLGKGYECLQGGGEMGAFLRSFDWANSLLGPVEYWPQSLRTSVSICLNSRFAILIWWGPDLVMLYNDAYRQVIGAKHPAALGRPGRECWPEIWHIINPMLEGVMHRGEATWSNDLLLMLERSGYPEECYFTFSYSPIRDESGGIGGVFTPVADTSERVINERRMGTLRDLAARAGGARDIRRALKAISETLLQNPYSIPFASLYLFDETRSTAWLAETAGIAPGASAAQPVIRLSELPGPLAGAVISPKLTVIDGLARLLGPLPSGAWKTPAQTGVVLPIVMPGQTSPLGFVLAGANPHKRMDQAYRTFFELVGGHISGAIAAAREYEEERRKVEALAEIDRAKTTFFSNVSHEFRTPLTLMLGPIEAMLERAADAPVHRDELQGVHRNGLRLLKLVNTLLDFSRIETGRVQALYQPTDLGAFTADIASAFRSAMERAGLEFVIDCPSPADKAYVDRDMWEKIVLNLVSNAFKFTLSGRVTVSLHDAGERFELAVEDTGVGIPEAELQRIFDRFHRVEGTRGRSHEGSGIGLAFVQELVKLHAGSIRVESELGRGSAFLVSIPKGQAHLPAGKIGTERSGTAAGVAATAYVEEALRWLPDDASPAAHAFASDTVQAPHADAAGARILLADDNADMRLYIRRLLGGNYIVQAVSNGLEALEAIHRDPPDLILTDIMMPLLDGFGLLRQVREGHATSTIPVILLSARAGEDARVEGLDAGADDYIVKPFTARELLARVSAHLAMSRLRREAAERERSLHAEAEAERQRVVNILESISDAFLALDPEWQITHVNAAAERTLRLSRAQLVGQVLWDVYPAVRGTELETQYRRAMTERVPTQVEQYQGVWGQWLEIRVYPGRDGGLSVFFQDVSERKRIEDEIRRNNQALKAANEDLEQFAYSLSHDLREPLRTVYSFCQLLQRDYSGQFDPRAETMIGFCLEGAKRMDALINDLLGYMHTASTEETVEPIPIQSAIEASLLNLQTAIEESLAQVTFDPMPVIRIARVHAQQIFQNLIGNALKYRASAPPRVHVGARKEGADWIFSVEDNGIGIEPQYRSQVFGLFQRLHANATRTGTGIGLALCKKLVERYGGRIWVESEPGKGSTFSFSMPVSGSRDPD
jgi:PAS domain S-box-containing protein